MGLNEKKRFRISVCYSFLALEKSTTSPATDENQESSDNVTFTAEEEEAFVKQLRDGYNVPDSKFEAWCRKNHHLPPRFETQENSKKKIKMASYLLKSNLIA